MNKLIINAMAVVIAAPVTSLYAQYQWGFANVSMNYLDWSTSTTHKSGKVSHKDDFAYIELEGGAGYHWGELYGFFDLENPLNKREDKQGDHQRYAFKTVGRYYLNDSGFNLHGQVYGIYSLPGDNKNFHELNGIYGFGYNMSIGMLWLKPFIALHYVDQTYYSGNNGYVAGWVAGYDFSAWNERFSITHWNEVELNRAHQYSVGNGSKNGINGAMAIWWTPVKQVTTGIQYRYARNKLGEDFLQNGIIYSVKYNF